MANRTVLINEIETLPEYYYNEVADFIADIKQRQVKETAENDYSSEKEAYQAMAADKERESEASEWCNAYFGPIHTK